MIFFSHRTEGSFESHTIASEPIGSDDSPHAVSLRRSRACCLGPPTPIGRRGECRRFFRGPRTELHHQRQTVGRHLPGDCDHGNLRQPGALINPSRAATTYHFEYGMGSASGTSTSETPVGSDGLSHGVSAAISGLLRGDDIPVPRSCDEFGRFLRQSGRHLHDRRSQEPRRRRGRHPRRPARRAL